MHNFLRSSKKSKERNFFLALLQCNLNGAFPCVHAKVLMGASLFLNYIAHQFAFKFILIFFHLAYGKCTAVFLLCEKMFDHVLAYFSVVAVWIACSAEPSKNVNKICLQLRTKHSMNLIISSGLRRHSFSVWKNHICNKVAPPFGNKLKITINSKKNTNENKLNLFF